MVGLVVNMIFLTNQIHQDYDLQGWLRNKTQPKKISAKVKANNYLLKTNKTRILNKFVNKFEQFQLVIFHIFNMFQEFYHALFKKSAS